MCGIVGVLVHKDNNCTITEPYLNSMRDTMRHRGPDGAGSWISKDGRVGLGHRRLSIIDLSTVASQPMSNEDGAIIITFNGEIYNHSEIRKELLAIGGHTWKTDHSDTEVIIHAYEQWGIDCIHRFRGMFAFAIWDGRQRCLWLVRDRMGIKPLYWTNVHGKFYFASEIKAIIEDKCVPRAISEEAFYHYLTFVTTPAPMTLFEGIYKLPAGYRMQVSIDGEIKEEKWWDVFDGVKKDHARSMDDWAAVLLDKLTESVKYRMVSDVPVGVFLSGGIDSSTNAVLFNRLAGGKKIKTFTIGYKDASTYNNEHKYARQISSMIGSEHHELDLTVKDLIDFLPRLIYHQDEPIADPVCIPIYYVSELARKNGVTVAQVGEGSDELFWGYPKWKYMFYLQKMNDWRTPNIIKRSGLDILKAFGKEMSVYYELLRRGTACQRIFWSGAEAFTEVEKNRILSNRLKTQFCGRSSYEVVDALFKRYVENAPEFSDLDWMTYCDLRLRLPELLLARVDKMSMATALEGRVPFLDHEFVQLSMSIPERIKTSRGELKAVLKRTVRGVVPDEIIDRKKQGFGVPVSEWMLKGLGPLTKNAIGKFCAETDLIDQQESVRLLEVGHPNAWCLLNLSLWWEAYING